MTLITRPEIRSLSPHDRSRAIYEASQAQLRSRLWSVALGSEPSEDTSAIPEPSFPNKAPFDLLSLVRGASSGPGSRPSSQEPTQTSAPTLPDTAPVVGELSLKANQGFAPTIEAAAQRTGLPPAALAAIIDAEAAKKSDGSWNVASRNPNSSAAGLTQFLSSTWESEAERPGTFLNNLAKANDWLNSKGHIRSSARKSLLSLRLDGRCAIEAAADFAKANLAQIERAGVKLGDQPGRIAQLAYIGHHLGAGDAARFMAGTLPADRAKHLLRAQIGSHEADRRIAAAGCAAAAHRAWLTEYVGRHINLSRFTRQA